jgi:hypothetical protein
MLQDQGPRTEEEMRAKVRELKRRIFPECKPWTARVLALRRLADEARTRSAARQLPSVQTAIAHESSAQTSFVQEPSAQPLFVQEPCAQAPFTHEPLARPARPIPIWLKDEAEAAPLGGPRPSLKAILFAVAAAFRVPVIDIVSHRRPRRICEARHCVYRMARDLTLLTLPQIGRRIGGRDHTTVLHGIRRTQALFPDLVLDPDASPVASARLMATLYRGLK